jgi:hypothetical protein
MCGVARPSWSNNGFTELECREGIAEITVVSLGYCPELHLRGCLWLIPGRFYRPTSSSVPTVDITGSVDLLCRRRYCR